MAITKRTRYEVLRRDNHTCRYCGGVAPEVILTVAWRKVAKFQEIAKSLLDSEED